LLRKLFSAALQGAIIFNVQNRGTAEQMNKEPQNAEVPEQYFLYSRPLRSRRKVAKKTPEQYILGEKKERTRLVVPPLGGLVFLIFFIWFWNLFRV